jgi:hypothetical protein
MAGLDDDNDFFEEHEPVEHSIEIAPQQPEESVINLNSIVLVCLLGFVLAWIIFRKSRQSTHRYTAPDSVGFPHLFP